MAVELSFLDGRKGIRQNMPSVLLASTFFDSTHPLRAFQLAVTSYKVSRGAV